MRFGVQKPAKAFIPSTFQVILRIAGLTYPIPPQMRIRTKKLPEHPITESISYAKRHREDKGACPLCNRYLRETEGRGKDQERHRLLDLSLNSISTQ